ncbi:MAG TPA: tetratricopeptide repeat protein [Polyangiaceae bacterium]|nr:tetratricopeptide repeat protein [Polyangiaceae bacterium]
MTHLTHIRCTLLVSVTLLCAANAFGDPKDAARALYEEGARLYNAGEYDLARKSFEQVYALTGARTLLFNIAQAHRLSGADHCSDALRAYESYLREDSSASNRLEVEERVAEMRACVERERARKEGEKEPEKDPLHQGPPVSLPVTAKLPETKPDIPPTPSPRSVLPLFVAGSGAVLAGVGGIFYWRAHAKFEQVRSTCPCPEGSFSGWQTLTGVSYGLLAVGGATFAGGLTWWLMSSKQKAGTSYTLQVLPDGVSLAGEF